MPDPLNIDFDRHELPAAADRLRARALGPRQRRQTDGRPDPAGLSARAWATRSCRRWKIRRRVRTCAGCGRATATRPRGSPSPPIRSWSGRCSSPAATSAGWPCTARSTIWRWAERPRSFSRRPSSSKKACRWTTCGGSSTSMRRAVPRGGRAARHRRHQGRRSRQGRPDLHHDVGHRPGSRRTQAVDPQRPARRSACSFRARSAITGSPSCRCARGSNSRRCSRATRPRCTI